MAKVGIVMGSDSDLAVMSKAAEILEKLEIDYEMTIISAHREPDVFFSYATKAEEKAAEPEDVTAAEVSPEITEDSKPSEQEKDATA